MCGRGDGFGPVPMRCGWCAVAGTRSEPARCPGSSRVHRRARVRPRAPSPRPGPCSASWRGRRPRRAQRVVPSRPAVRPLRSGRSTRRRRAAGGAAPDRRSRGTTRATQSRERRPVTRVDVGVAVDAAPAQCDGEEGAAPAQHDRPIADLGDSLRDESPACLSDVAGGRTADAEATDGRVDTVRTDNEVVGAGRAVREAHPFRLAFVLEICHREAEPDRNFDAPRAESLVQRRSANRDTGSDTVPVAANVDVGEQAATVVENPLPHDRVRTSGQLRPDSELVERPDAVAGQVQAGAARLPLGHPLDDLGRDLPLP